MIVTFVHVWVKEDKIADFIKITRWNHEESIKEPGNLRFDFLQDATQSNKFTLYEAYDSEESAAAHKNSPHYLKWRETVADWMAKPREGIKHKIISPAEREKW